MVAVGIDLVGVDYFQKMTSGNSYFCYGLGIESFLALEGAV